MEEQHKIILASHLGFCNGVKAALARFDACLKTLPSGESLYILHELVHNSEVTRQMTSRGARFIDDPQLLPQGAAVLIGAHGATREEEEAIAARTPHCIDATCPVIRHLREQLETLDNCSTLLCLGDRDHQEMRCLVSFARARQTDYSNRLDEIINFAKKTAGGTVLLCQTSLSYHDSDAIQQRLARENNVTSCIGGTCKESRLRQKAVEELAQETDAIIVVASPHSANGRQLRAIAQQSGHPAWLVETPEEIPTEALKYKNIGVTAAASAPSEQIQRILKALQA